MEPKKLVEHYRDHEVSCTAESGPKGWRYSVSVVTHDGDESTVHRIDGESQHATDLEALHAGLAAGRRFVDAES